MKTVYLFLILQLLFAAVSAQNYVPNHSFEQTGCGNPYITVYKFCSWTVPPNDGNTPDGFEGTSPLNCFPCSCLPNQNTMAGDTYPLDGQYFAGILGYYIQGGQVNAREYIHAQLVQPLVAGQSYFIGFGVKHGGRSKYVIDHMGMFISDTAIGPSNTAPLYDLIPVTPQVDISQPLGDSLSWTYVSAIYTAAGGEQYVTIGNFTPDSLLNISINPNNSPADTTCLLARYGAYYFIDDVFVYEEAPTSANEEDNEGPVIYPNPAAEMLYIDSEGANFSSFSIREVWAANVVGYGKLGSGIRTHAISVQALVPGVYILELAGADGKAYKRKFVKR
jgi:hypothetical protein